MIKVAVFCTIICSLRLMADTEIFILYFMTKTRCWSSCPLFLPMTKEFAFSRQLIDAVSKATESAAKLEETIVVVDTEMKSATPKVRCFDRPCFWAIFGGFCEKIAFVFLFWLASIYFWVRSHATTLKGDLSFFQLTQKQIVDLHTDVSHYGTALVDSLPLISQRFVLEFCPPKDGRIM